MNIKTLVLGKYEVNCYIVSDGNGNAVVIDPGYEPELILSEIEKNKLSVGAVLLTHAHFDHVGATKKLGEVLSCPIYLNEKDKKLPQSLIRGLYFTDGYSEGDVIKVGELEFSVLSTPGHSPGSVCLKCGNSIFSGDTLFAGACGRCDLGGSVKDMKQSLSRLAAFECDDIKIYPGHGEASTLGFERQTIENIINHR